MSQSNNTYNLTNVYPLQNLNTLDEYYTLFQIESPIEVNEREKQLIKKKLSYDLKHPATVVQHKGSPHLVLLNDEKVISKLDPKFDLVGRRARFKPTGEIIRLDFSDPSSEVKKICQRVLQFVLQGELSRKYKLWQPSAGHPFFKYIPYDTRMDIDIFEGSSARIVVSADNNFGVSIDVTKRYVSSKPYPIYLNSSDFSRNCKGNHCLYKYGKMWYELNPIGISGDTVSEAEIVIDNEYISLLEHIRNTTSGAYSPELADLPEDASVLIYKNNTGEKRFVPAGMCFQVYDTEDPATAKLHHLSILNPKDRHREIAKFQQEFVKDFNFGNNTITVDPNPMTFEKKFYRVPDLEFGKGRVLSVRKTKNTDWVKLWNLGRRKKDLALNPQIGFYASEVIRDFGPQYVVMPRSVHDKMGKNFIGLLKELVDEMYYTEEGWNPKILTYEDKVKKGQDYVQQFPLWVASN